MAEETSSTPMGELCLIGYRGLRHKKFFGLLREANTRIMVDVRRNPYSPNPDYQKAKLEEEAPVFGVKYFHVPALGAPGAGNSPINPGEPTTVEEQLASPLGVKALARVIELLKKGYSVALMCAEVDYRTCHRPKIVAALLELEPTLTLHELTYPEVGLF